MDLTGIDPVFVKSVEVLETFSADDHNRMLYEARLKEWRDNKSRMDGALAECELKHQRQMRELFAFLESGVPLAEAKKRMGLS